MVDEDPKPVSGANQKSGQDSAAEAGDGPDIPAQPDEFYQIQTNSGTEKAALRKLEEAKNQRNQVISTSKVVLRNAVIALAVVLAGFAAFQLFDAPADNTAPEDRPAPDTGGTMTAVQCDKPDEFAGIPDHPCYLKTQFQNSYKDLSTQYIPTLQASAAEGFVQEELAKILELEESAIQAFDRSEYPRAVDRVDEALRIAETLKQLINDRFEKSLRDANAAFLADDADQAQALIDKALRLNGNDANALALHARIVVLPEVLALLKSAAETEAQNQLVDLQKILQKIVGLDPYRLQVSMRLATLSEQIKRATYNAHLEQASDYIKAQNIQAARQEVANANAIYPGQQDTAALSEQIETIEKDRRINALLQDADAMKSQDNWPAVMTRFEQILSEDASNRVAINGREKAKKIISANNRVVNILNRQIRLQDATVYQKTLEFLDLIKPLAQDSKTLAASIGTLEQRLDLWQQKVTVTVRSDGKSQVSVRRVGQVGKVKQKDIMLRPGNYDFECNRAGYQSKIVEHFVPPGQNGTAVTISCDVRI